MIPTRLRADADAAAICNLAVQWRIDARLAYGLHDMARLLPFPISIISGYRTAEEQSALLRDPSKTAAADHLSTHRSCPATGADIRVQGTQLTDEVKRQVGRAAQMVGLRWGGGARRENGIPVGNEWAHVDLGPRQGS